MKILKMLSLALVVGVMALLVHDKSFAVTPQYGIFTVETNFGEDDIEVKASTCKNFKEYFTKEAPRDIYDRARDEGIHRGAVDANFQARVKGIVLDLCGLGALKEKDGYSAYYQGITMANNWPARMTVIRVIAKSDGRVVIGSPKTTATEPIIPSAAPAQADDAGVVVANTETSRQATPRPRATPQSKRSDGRTMMAENTAQKEDKAASVGNAILWAVGTILLNK